MAKDKDRKSEPGLFGLRLRYAIAGAALTVLGFGIGVSLGPKPQAQPQEAAMPLPESSAPQHAEALAVPDLPVITLQSEDPPAEPEVPEPEVPEPEVPEPEATPPDPASVAVPVPDPDVAPVQVPPAWLQNAVAAEIANGPLIAIVIDDMGVDQKRSERIAALAAPLTLAYLSYARDLQAQTKAARSRGHELLMHVAMEPESDAEDGGPHVLEVDMSETELQERLVLALSQFDGYVGINNHMGSRFTADPKGMALVMRELQRRGLLFLDSKTSAASIGKALADQFKVPSAERHIFLDNENELAAVLAQLNKTEEIALANGFAIAIGHPRDGTLAALEQWLPEAKRKGFALVPLSAIVKLAKPDG